MIAKSITVRFWRSPRRCAALGMLGPTIGEAGQTVIHIEGEIQIGRPVEEVFDFVADQCNEPRYNPRMLTAEKVTDGPIGVGTQFAATTKTGRGIADMVIEVTAFDRPTHLASATTLSTMDISGALSFEPTGNGTCMRWSWYLEPRGALKLMGPIVAVVGRRNEKAIWASLKELLEAGPRDQEGTHGTQPTDG